MCVARRPTSAKMCAKMLKKHRKYKLFCIFIWAPVGPNLGWFIFIIFAGLLIGLQNGIVEIAKKTIKLMVFLYIFARGALSADAMC